MSEVRQLSRILIIFRIWLCGCCARLSPYIEKYLGFSTMEGGALEDDFLQVTALF